MPSWVCWQYLTKASEVWCLVRKNNVNHATFSHGASFFRYLLKLQSLFQMLNWHLTLTVKRQLNLIWLRVIIVPTWLRQQYPTKISEEWSIIRVENVSHVTFSHGASFFRYLLNLQWLFPNANVTFKSHC